MNPEIPRRMVRQDPVEPRALFNADWFVRQIAAYEGILAEQKRRITSPSRNLIERDHARLEEIRMEAALDALNLAATSMGLKESMEIVRRARAAEKGEAA